MKRSFISVLAVMVFTAAVMASCGRAKEALVIRQPEETMEQTQKEETDTEKKEEGELSRKEDSPQEEKRIWVDVGGAVKNPGVYQLKENARIFDAVNAAGGFLDTADIQWLNQAAAVKDGEKILVYTEEETRILKEQGEKPDSTVVSEQEENLEESSKVNLNTATLAQLQEIPGIGQVRAQAILDYREKAGRFDSIEQVQEVSGIKGKTFEKIAEYISAE